MKLIVGLGNPGSKYASTRHNIGFMFVAFLKNQVEQERKVQFKEEKKLHVTSYTLHDLTLALPQTFMNLSGTAVKSCVTRYKPSTRAQAEGLHVSQDLIVIHDDLDIPLGKFKIQKGTGPRMHNGIESIEKALGTKDFTRVRIGIDNRKRDDLPAGALAKEGETYVLQNFTQEEEKAIQDLFPQIWKRLKSMVFI